MIDFKLIILPIFAALLTAAIMPLVRKFSILIGNVDKPKAEVRKLHHFDVPMGGGIAIFIGFLIATLAFDSSSPEILWLLTVSSVLIVAGILDEIFDLSSFTRLIIQFVAAITVVSVGIRVDVIGNFGNGNDGLFYLGDLSTIFTVLWIVGVTNAIRVLDGIDGLAAGVTSIAAWTLGIVALMTNRPDAAMLSFILGAVAFAYLPYNFSSNPKRKIFMADSGSTFLGFALACVSVMGSIKTAAAFSMLVPIIVLILPIFDFCIAVLRRLIAGKSPFKADGLHLHHRLLKMGLSHKQTAGIFYAASIILGIIAICSTGLNGRLIIVIFFVTLISFIIFLWKLGLIKVVSKNKK